MYNQDVEAKNSGQDKKEKEYYALKILNSSMNLSGHLLVSAVTVINLFYALRNGLPLNANDMHIFLCVLGFQCLMAEGILYLSPHNGPSKVLTFVDKIRAHWGLQVLGSALGLAGCFIKILDKEVHWNTAHGQFALVAMVFIVACFFNGLTSLYPNKLRFIPTSLSKLTHICFGVVAFAAATISLCYGYDKPGFKNWLSPANGLVTTSITFTALLLAIVIVNPIIVFGFKSMNVIKSR